MSDILTLEAKQRADSEQALAARRLNPCRGYPYVSGLVEMRLRWMARRPDLPDELRDELDWLVRMFRIADGRADPEVAA